MGTGELWHRRMEDHTENVVEQSRVELGQIFILFQTKWSGPPEQGAASSQEQ